MIDFLMIIGVGILITVTFPIWLPLAFFWLAGVTAIQAYFDIRKGLKNLEGK